MDAPEITPAPWLLEGSAYLLMMSFSRDWVREHAGVPASLNDHFQGGPGLVLVVDYARSNVGPYGELMLIPGRFRRGGQSYHSITKIFVTSQASVDSGRENWAIPKDLCSFSVERSDRQERLRFSVDGEVFADLTFQTSRLSMPVHSRLLPGRLRTLLQVDGERALLTTPEGSGRLRKARLVDARIDPARFPRFTDGRILGAFQLSPVTLRFPVARDATQSGNTR